MAMDHAGRTAADVRAALGHPVIDVDGHMLEVEPLLLDYLKDVAGPRLVERYTRTLLHGGFWGWYDASDEERRQMRIKRAPFWMFPASNTLDRATAMLPGLMRSRMDEFGIDFSFLYPTQALLFAGLDDEEMRRAVIRATNVMNADNLREHSDRLAPVAAIPMHTPGEALEEIEFAVGELGMKGIMIEGVVRRPIDASASKLQDMASAPSSYWIDPLALDSPYDYDPVWQKCCDLKVAPTMHTSTMGWVDRTSISNLTFNHIGHFAAGSQSFCKALVLGGVTRRFPTLKFAFLECGVGWAASVYNDLIEHWEKRNVNALRKNLDPKNIDRDQLAELFAIHGNDRLKAKADAVRVSDGAFFDGQPEMESDIDDWEHCGIEKVEDIYDLFASNFYFGCEADDRVSAWAFDRRVNRFGAQFKAMLGSDIGHFDVTDAAKVLCEAHSLVDEGILTDDDFRSFVFANAAELHGGTNPDTFKGTVVEDDVAKLLVERGDGRQAAE